uniref:Calmodulin n=1 Tax=Alexandrium monilatum TaxID=311494 RepID=A0A7S4VR84_9DINO
MGNNSGSQSSLEQAAARLRETDRLAIEGRYHRSPQRLEDDYVLDTKALGTGFNGAVLLARSKESGVKFAVKPFKLHGVSKEKREELVMEAEIFLRMDHPHVVRLHHVYEGEETLSLVMECMEGGELFDRVTERKVFSEKDAAGATHQMLLAVNYIHSSRIVHRDLKLENFLYEKKDSDFLKLIDFGFSKIWEKNTKMELSCGTLAYVAPEVLGKNYTSQCDMWSLGVIVFILLVGHMPFSGASERQQIAAIRAGKYVFKRDRWAKVSEEALDFVKKLLVVDEKVRLTAEQALKHPWLNRQFSSETKVTNIDDGIAEAIMCFARESKFRRCVMQLMAWSLTAEERAEVRGAFLELDTRKTGTVRLSELKQVLEAKFHMTEANSAEILRALDSNNDDEINYSEFLAAMVSSRIALHDDLLKTTFKRFDLGNDGYIWPKELQQVLGENVDIKEIMRQVDSNNDGKISTTEFMAFVRNGNMEEQHAEAVSFFIDKEISREMVPEKAPRMRKRDKLLQFAQACVGTVGNFSTHFRSEKSAELRGAGSERQEEASHQSL